MEDVNRYNEPNQKSRSLLMYMDIANTITNICLGAAAFAAIFVIQTGSISTLRKSHIALVTLGYILMMTQAVHAMNKRAGWARALKHNQRKSAHLVVEVIGLVLAVSGTSIAIANSSMTEKSNHGIFGITTLALTCVTTLGGIFHYFFYPRIRLPTGVIHACFGCLSLTMAFITFTMGLHYFYSSSLATMFSFLTILALVGTILNVVIGRWKK